jgi:hypothetical protein
MIILDSQIETALFHQTVPFGSCAIYVYYYIYHYPTDLHTYAEYILSVSYVILFVTLH